MTVVIWLALIALAVIVAVTLLPMAGVLAGGALVSRRGAPLVGGVMLIAASVMLGLWLWPKEYAYVRYYEEVPRDASGVAVQVEQTKQVLREAGFGDIFVSTTGSSGARAYCWVDSTSPAEGANADTRERITINERCSGRAK